MQAGGLENIIDGVALVANSLTDSNLYKAAELDAKRQKELGNLEELGAQCARALRNLSVNGKTAAAASFPSSLVDMLMLMYCMHSCPHSSMCERS